MSLTNISYGQCNQYVWADFKAVNSFMAMGGVSLNGAIVNLSVQTNYAINLPTILWTESSGQIGETKICFNEYVCDPAISFTSLGSGSIKVTLKFDTEYKPFILGNNINYIDKNTLSGNSGNGTIIFPGIHKCITITSANRETTAIRIGLPKPTFPIIITGRSAGCESVSLTASGGEKYVWSGGEDLNSSTNKFYSSGVYSVTAFDKQGCTTKNIISVTILPKTPVISNVQKTICFGESYLGYKQSGIYSDTFKTYLGCDSIRILNLNVINLKIERFNNYNKICPGKSLELKPIVTSNSYPMKFKWSTGDTTLAINVNSFGNYKLSVSYLNCSITDSIDIKNDFLTTNGGIDTLCLMPKDDIKLNAGLNNSEYEYIWNHTSEKSQTAIVSNKGTYTLKIVSPSGCETKKEFVVLDAPKVDLGPEKVFCAGESINIKPSVQGTGIMSFEWSSGQYTKNISLDEPGLYFLKVIQNGCIIVDSIKITTKPCVNAPNTFTPNNDGINDIFEVFINKGTVLKFEILNKWNNIIYTYTSPIWDGKINNINVPQDLYYYKLLVSLNGEVSSFSNSFFLLR